MPKHFDMIFQELREIFQKPFSWKNFYNQDNIYDFKY